jgi:glycyl-tRNA synthetase beta chain
MRIAPLLIELLTEELPPKSLKKLGESFSQKIFDQLARLDLLAPNASFQSFATPRRLAILIDQVYEKSSDKQVKEKLLPVSIALDANGNPSGPLIKKLAALGITDPKIEEFERIGEGKNEAFYVSLTKPGVSLLEGAQEALNTSISQLPIAKTMHYQLHPGTPEEIPVQFVRPAHGLIALFGSEIIPLTVFGLTARKTTLGHRFLSKGPIEIHNASEYENILIQQGKVLPSFNGRLEKISQDLISTAGSLNVLMPQSLLEEVNSLVEWPAVYACSFEKEFLEVPQECLILTMQTNQKYFALTDAQGKLVNQFLIVSNITTATPEKIISGNERVVRPRLSDARFFYTQDRKRKLFDRVPELAKVVYHNKLGNQLERIQRIEVIAKIIASNISSNQEDLVMLASRAALIIKTDLLTDMVGEFPELQGIMGTYYANHDQEHPDVASACSEHYLPRFAGGVLPSTMVGTVLALADKLETIVGIWGIGLSPTGEKDPFALRRHALGVCRLLVEKNLPLNLITLLTQVKEAFNFEEVQKNADLGTITNFVMDRLRSYLKEHDGITYSSEEVEAVLANCAGDLTKLPEKLSAVRSFSQMEMASDLANANKRISNILKKNDLPIPSQVDVSLLTVAAEKELFREMTLVTPQIDQAMKDSDFTRSLQLLAQLSSAVTGFFADVMVNDPDLQLRGNRLALLTQLHQQMSRIADLSQLAK